MKYVSVLELRNNLAEILTLVASGNSSVVVTKHDKPVVIMKYYKESSKEDPFLKFFGFLGPSKETGEEFVNRVRRNKRERDRVHKLRNRSI